jgi:hypothetical protein
MNYGILESVLRLGFVFKSLDCLVLGRLAWQKCNPTIRLARKVGQSGQTRYKMYRSP